MRRQNRQKATNALSQTLWNNAWQTFCPWVAGADVSRPDRSDNTSSRRRRSKAVRNLCAAALLFITLGAAPVQAANYQENGKNLLQYASYNPSTPLDRDQFSSAPRLFGHGEQKHSDITPFTKWTGVITRTKMEFAQPVEKRAVKKWLAFLDSIRTKSTADKIEAVNAYLNKIPFVADTKNYGVSDYWATPTQFLTRGGDCEDYAVTKYISLRALGVPKDKMRLAIVEDHVMRIPHAVLVVFDRGEAKVLDNQNPIIMNSASISRYTPIYSISQVAWWRH